LLQEWLLKEATFRVALENKDWEDFRNKYTLLYCSNDAIIPQWAYMLIAFYLQRVNSKVFLNVNLFEEEVMIAKIQIMDLLDYENKRILIKGCSKKNISPYPYSFITQRLTPVAKSVAFGESCSSVPLFKNL
jgi:hypothetical protein